MYETPKEFDKQINLTKKLPFSSTFLEVHVLLGTEQYQQLSVE